MIFDAVQRAAARGADLVLADTAGRLHTKVNLMEELRKVRRVADREPGKVTEVLLVLDATTGQNGLVQAEQFTEAVDLTGVVLTKLDGSAKGGIVLAIQSELGIPVKLVGLGESRRRPRRVRPRRVRRRALRVTERCRTGGAIVMRPCSCRSSDDRRRQVVCQDRLPAGKLSARSTYRVGRFIGLRRVLSSGSASASGCWSRPRPGRSCAPGSVASGSGRRAPATDDAVAERVRYELSHSPRTWHLPQPEVEVVAGTAILTGGARHATGKADLERAAAAVPGVGRRRQPSGGRQRRRRVSHHSRRSATRGTGSA